MPWASIGGYKRTRNPFPEDCALLLAAASVHTSPSPHNLGAGAQLVARELRRLTSIRHDLDSALRMACGNA